MRKPLLAFAIGWTLLIGYLCLADFEKLPGGRFPYFDKFVHAGLHFVLTLSWYLFLKQTGASRRPAVIAFCISILYGIGIEFAQEYFTLHRTGDPIDVIANTTGAGLAMVAAMMYLGRKHNR